MMKRSIGMLAITVLYAVSVTASIAKDRGYVIIRTRPGDVDTIGVGPGACFWSPERCAPGVVLRKDGTGALLELGMKEAYGFTFDRGEFSGFAKQISEITYRGLGCKMMVTDAGGASVFWSDISGDRITLSFSNGCVSKEDGPIVSLYDKILGLTQVQHALAKRKQEVGAAAVPRGPQ